MDTRSTLDYEFMNLDNVDENVASEIRAILRTDITSDVLKLPWDNGEKDFNSNSVIPEMQPEVQNHWQPYDETLQAYDVTSTTPSLLTPPMSGMYTAGAIMQVSYPEWQTCAYPASPTADPTYYVPSVAYPSTIYQPAPAAEVLATQSPTREDRRSNRNRSRKNDNYNRVMNQNDLQSTYMMQQGQFNQMQAMCHPGVQYYVPSQQHPAAGRPIFVPSHQYSAIPMHHNNPQQQYQHPLSNYQHQHPPAIKQHRNTQNYGTIYNPDKGLSQGQLQKNDKNSYEHQHSQSFRQPLNHKSSGNSNSHQHQGRNPRFSGNSQSDEGRREKEVKSARVALVIAEQQEPQTNGLVNGEKVASHCPQVLEEVQALEIGYSEVDDVGTAEENAGKNKVMVAVVTEVETRVEAKVEERVEARVEARVEPKVEAKVEVKVEKKMETKVEAPIEKVEDIVKMNGQNQKEEKITKIEDDVGVKTEAANVSAGSAWASKTFASILRKTSAGTPPGFIQHPTPAFKLPPAVRSNATNTVNNVCEEKVKQVTGKVDDDNKGEAVGPASAEEQGPATIVDSRIAERKSLPIDHVQTPLNHPLMYRMGEFLLNYQMDKQTVSLLPRGLTNRSNYCYINSILQALLACPPFYNLLRALPNSRHPLKNSSTPLIDNMVKFVNEFMPVPEGERQPRKDKGQKKNDDTFDIKGGNAFEPSYVYTMLQNTASAGVFSIEGRQEDAEEFLSCLLNGISDEMLELMKQVSDHSQNSKRTEDLNMSSNSGDEEWKVMGPKNKGSITRCTEFERTPLSDIFRGQLRSRILRQGDQSTDNVQPFFTLQLDIEKAESVKAALEILVGKDQVEGMTCSKTKQQIQAWKQVTLEELPVVLILHLKWFDYKLDGCSKIFKNVAYAIDLKIDGKILSPNAAKKLTAKQKQYKLFAVTYHDGKEATKGHYVTDAFHVGFGTWVRYDDSSVRGICETDVLNPSPPRVPYLLYYRRCDTIGNQPNNPRAR